VLGNRSFMTCFMNNISYLIGSGHIDSRGGHPWFSHWAFHLFDLICWFCEQLMRSREEIRVRASCYDNEQYANSKYTYSWDHLLCQKATLFREVGINSIVPSI